MKTIHIAMVLLSSIGFTACMDAPGTSSDSDDPTAPASDNEVLAPYQPLLQRVFNAADPVAAYDQLNAEDRAIVDRATQPYGDLETHFETAPADDAEGLDANAHADALHAKFSGCWALHFTGKRKAFFGNTIYTYWQNTNVCASGGKVTKVSVTNAGGETSTPGWRIRHAPATSTYNPGWEGRGKAQYYFVLGVGGWDIHHPSDCLQGRLNADGSHYRVMTSCDLQAK